LLGEDFTSPLRRKGKTHLKAERKRGKLHPPDVCMERHYSLRERRSKGMKEKNLTIDRGSSTHP